MGREKPWHQDHSYFNIPIEPAANGAPTTVIGLWVALDSATLDNGCMHVLPAEHDKPVDHFKVRDWQICDTLLLNDQNKPRIQPLPMEPGDALFFSSLLPHGTAPNKSANRRRAIQFHFAIAGAKRCADADRFAIFGGEGKGVLC